MGFGAVRLHGRQQLSRSSEDLDVVRPAGGIAGEADPDFGDAGAQDIARGDRRSASTSPSPRRRCSAPSRCSRRRPTTDSRRRPADLRGADTARRTARDRDDPAGPSDRRAVARPRISRLLARSDGSPAFERSAFVSCTIVLAMSEDAAAGGRGHSAISVGLAGVAQADARTSRQTTARTSRDRQSADGPRHASVQVQATGRGRRRILAENPPESRQTVSRLNTVSCMAYACGPRRGPSRRRALPEGAIDASPDRPCNSVRRLP